MFHEFVDYNGRVFTYFANYANVVDKLHLTFDFIFWSTADFDCCMFTKNCQIYAEQNNYNIAFVDSER